MTKNFAKLLFLTLFLISCGEKQTVEPQTASLTCQPTSFAKISGWSQDNLDEAYHAFELTCEKLKNSRREFLGQAALKISTKDYLTACAKKPSSSANFRDFLEKNFIPCLVQFDGEEQGKFTSYYEAEIYASKTPSSVYNSPIYGKPNDLISINLQDFDKSLPAKRLVGRIENNQLIPYFTREEISKQEIDAPIILWGNDAVDIYVMQIQGSAVARLEDGSRVRIGFADTNGRTFRGIGSILLENGVIGRGQASMGKIKEWLKANPQIADQYLNQNQRYVFHRLNEDEGPIGALGVLLTAGRSLAVDKSFIPLGTLLWLETTGPHQEPIEKLVIAQDIGGAIKGAVRGDYFWGSGGDDVLELAGKMNATGRYFVLMPKQGE